MWGLWPKIISWALGPSEEAAWLSDPRFKPYHDRQRTNVQGGILPRTLKIRNRGVSKPLKRIPKIHEKNENTKYLNKSCHHYIKCTTATFLATLMWRRPLNNATLATTIHKELKEVSDRTDVQVEVWMIDKCKAQMIGKCLYNV